MSSELRIKGTDQTRRFFRPALLFISMAWKAGFNLNKDLLKTEEETQLIRHLREGGAVARKAKETIVKKLQPLIEKVAKLFARVGFEQEDLVQDGNIGLMEAMDKYDLRSGLKFSLFALSLIGSKIARAVSGYRAEMSSDSDIDKIPPLDVIGVESSTLMDDFISHHLSFLNAKERGVLELMIGLGMNPQEAGKILGLNRSETLQLKRTALDKIRTEIALAQQKVYQQLLAIEQVRIFFNSAEERLPN